MGEQGGSFSNKLLQLKDGKSGPGDEEIIGLDVEDRKRRRSGPESKRVMDTDDVLANPESVNKVIVQHEAGLSNMDCSASSQQYLATLAQQASRSL